MRRTLITITMLCSFTLLFGTSYRQSDSIGQDRGAFVDDQGYHLALDGDNKTLYGPDGEIWTEKEETTSADQKIITRSKNGTIFLRQWFSKGNIIKEETNGQTLEYSYSEDQRLQRINYLQNDILQKTELFSYDASNGNLLAVITIQGEQSTVRYFHDTGTQHYFTYADQTNGQTFLTLDVGATISQSFTSEADDKKLQVVVGEKGAFSIERTRSDGTALTESYDASGLLVLLETPSYQTKYQYNEGRTITSELTTYTNGNETYTTYNDGEKSVVEEREAGRTTSILKFQEDGTRIQTLYSQGRPYCDITYAAGGKRILSISYR